MLNKIIIVGEAGRGKTTLAKKLAERLAVPQHSTDDFYYEVRFSKIRPREEALEQIKRFYEESRWIVEGTTIWLLEPGIAQADKIIFLKHKNLISQWMILVRRYFQREEDTIKGTLQLMRHVFYKRYSLGYKKGKMTHEEFIEPYKDRVIEFSSFKEIEEFLKSIK